MISLLTTCVYMLDDLYPQYFQVYIQRSEICFEGIKSRWIQNEAKKKKAYEKLYGLMEEIVWLDVNKVSEHSIFEYSLIFSIPLGEMKYENDCSTKKINHTKSRWFWHMPNIQFPTSLTLIEYFGIAFHHTHIFNY